MSEQGGGGHESLSLWENQLWVNVSNSDNTNSGGTGTGSDEKSNSAAKKTDLQDDETQKNNKRGRGAGKNGKGKAAAAAAESSDHEMHIWTERERRKKMRNMFSNLHALLPQLPPKADKSTIVDEAVNHIKTLEQTLQKLQKQKLERLQLQSGIRVGHSEPLSISNLTTQKQAFESSSREAFLADQVSSSDQQLNVSASTNTFSSSISSVSNDQYQFFPASFQTWTSSNVVLNLCGNQAQISVCSAKKPGLFTSICYILEKHKIGVISAHVSSNSNQTMFMIQAHAGEGCNQIMSEGFDPVEEKFKQAAAEIMSCVSS